MFAFSHTENHLPNMLESNRNKSLNHHSAFGSQSLSYSPDRKCLIAILLTPTCQLSLAKHTVLHGTPKDPVTRWWAQQGDAQLGILISIHPLTHPERRRDGGGWAGLQKEAQAEWLHWSHCPQQACRVTSEVWLPSRKPKGCTSCLCFHPL